MSAAGVGDGDSGDKRVKSKPGLTLWNPTSTAEERRAFYQNRLALFAKILFWVFVILLIWVNLMYYLEPVLRPEKATFITAISAAGLIGLGISWRLVLVRRRLSQTALFAWDIAITEVVGVVLAFASWMSPDKPANVVSMFVWALFLVFARVAIVPSHGKRTIIISTGALIPHVVTSALTTLDQPLYIGTPSLAFIIATTCYAAVAVFLAGLGSHVIYGLRQRVQEAEQLGQYSLLEKIGAGGMGTVYKARHAMMRRPTAIKCLSMEKAGAESLARFEREVQLTSELTHPNTIAIYDYGRSPDGVFYYVMEYLEGIDLERLVKKHGPQPPGRVIRILAQVCGALDEAHDRGLIHRDIKPANIILCCRGKVPDVAKVLDFGLVKDIEESSGNSDLLAGTPAYLAPELIVKGTIGPAGDLYAVGAVGYFLLTGRQVFDAKAVIEMCVHHISSTPVPPGRRVAGVPEDLEALILQCLEKDPDDRPESAEILRERLLSLSSADRWSTREAKAWWAEHPPSPTGTRSGTPSTMTVDLRDRTGAHLGSKSTLLGI